MTNAPAPNAALLIIGNEILSGRTKDKNAAWIGEHLSEIGVPLMEVRVVPDIRTRIITALNDLRAAHTYVFTTGGIGPTHDDITSETIAEAFNLPWETHAQAYQILEDYYGADDFTPVRQKMAKTPRGAKLIPNPVSAAPGFIVENVHVMAGIPKIMQAMMGYILPTLQHGQAILSETIICDTPESIIAAQLGEVQARYPDIDIGSYPRFEKGTHRLSIVLRGTDEAQLKKALSAVEELIQKLSPTY